MLLRRWWGLAVTARCPIARVQNKQSDIYSESSVRMEGEQVHWIRTVRSLVLLAFDVLAILAAVVAGFIETRDRWHVQLCHLPPQPVPTLTQQP